MDRHRLACGDSASERLPFGAGFALRESHGLGMVRKVRNVKKTVLVLAGLGFATIGFSTGVSAQDGVRRPPAVFLTGGWSTPEVDSLAGGSVIGVGLELPLADWAMIVPTVQRRESAFPTFTKPTWALDFAFQTYRDFGRISPYLGFALGAAFDLRDERAFTEDFVVATYGGMAGARYSLSRHLVVRGEGRYRFLDGFDQGTLLTTVGIGWLF